MMIDIKQFIRMTYFTKMIVVFKRKSKYEDIALRGMLSCTWLALMLVEGAKRL